ncbi:MAG TPA: ribonuclease III [Dehalococcoidia bacterium]|nr:ribonuclease III [Dehalococcoidia bacterium]
MVSTKAPAKPRSPQTLQTTLGISFRHPPLLEQALVHRSCLNEVPEQELESNERLEFLGDAVLGLVVSEKLYRDYPALSEGHLSQIRSLLVRWDTLAEAARRIDLGDFLILGRGEELSGGRGRPSNLAGALEALIGAAFLDGGLTRARSLVLRLLKPDLDEIAARGVTADSKSALQHVAQTRWRQIPLYRLVSSEGPDHAKLFTVEVMVGSQVMGRGQGRNKKQAELDAARQALEELAAAAN